VKAVFLPNAWLLERYSRFYGKLLGGQIVGKEGVAKRIGVFAAALHAGFTLDEMINLDLSYAPVWDPVIIAFRHALKQL
jgi:hypothetical protein